MADKDPHKSTASESFLTSEVEENRAFQLALGLLFGVIFGFLLQKGGVGKYHILMGMLLLKDFTVFKVMMSALFLLMAAVHYFLDATA